MKLKDLAKFDLPESVISAWIKRQGDYLLPLQERAIKGGLLGTRDGERPPNLLISAPTSSGKSFCGEIASIVSLLKRKKAVMLVPLKSIAEEKHACFQDCYASLGIRILTVTGDHPENDADFQLGNFDLALAIYEKFNRLLTVNLDILQQIGLIVVDELQMIGSPRRGAELEMALVKVISSGYDPRIVALSAVLDDESELAGWLGCNVIRETVRPVDLLQGIAADGYFRFRSFNSGLEGKERFALKSAGGDLAENLIEFLKNDTSQKLVFLKSRRDTIEAAFRLAAAVRWKEAKTALAGLEGEETSFLIRSLRQTLSRGVAFHNADLTAPQRRAVEQGYRRGQIRVIFSTTTLAMGVNLPAEMVLLETVKYTSGNFGGKPSLVPITAADFQNIAGRAGRFGLGPSRTPGRAVVLAGSDFEYEVLWSQYVDSGKKEKLKSALADYDLIDVVLDLVVSGLGSNPEKCLSKLFYCRQGNRIDEARLTRILEELMSSGLVGRSFQPTRLGAAVAETGISTGSCRHYMRLVSERHPETPVGWLLAALTGPEFDISHSGMMSSEYHRRTYERLIYQCFSEYITEIGAYIETEIGREPLTFRISAILKAVFLLADWAGGVPVEKLEQRYQLHHGQIINLAETAAWLLASIGRLVYAADCNSEIPRHVEALAFEVQFGISSEMREVFRLAGEILNRADYKLLKDNNMISVRELRGAGGDYLTGIIKSESKIKRLFDQIENVEQEDKMDRKLNSQRGQGATLAPLMADYPGFHPSCVELDGTYEKERFLIRVDGLPVRLTGKSFKYLVKLAFSRLANGEGWIYKDDIEIGFNQARYLYRLKQEMRAGGFSWPIFENNRLGYYRLDLEPSKIRLNLENLKDHSDYELRQIADELAPRMAV